MYFVIIAASLVVLFVCSFFLLNKLMKCSIWWKNLFVFTKQFQENGLYDIVNVGSNPARFAFFYEDVKGQNWSTGTQGMDWDLKILQKFESRLQKGAYILLPIVAFSSVSGYLTDQPLQYRSKYASFMGEDRKTGFSQCTKYLKYPLLYEWRFLFRAIMGHTLPDKRLEITENPLQLVEMEKDAEKWMNIWKKEFLIEDIERSLPEHLSNGRALSINMMTEMITYLKCHGYKPVIISPPMSSSLAKYFTLEVRETFIYSFVRSVQSKVDVPYLDYSDSIFQNNDYFFNALYMNLRGRKLFTRRVIEDINL